MKNSWTIARREYRSFFESLVAYILLATFLGITGFFTWLISRGNVFFLNEASLQVFFSVSFWTVFFFIPALTMRMIAEERRTGTLEALLARAVSDWQVVLGKYTACLLLILTALAFTLPYYFTVSWFGKSRPWGGLVWLPRTDISEFFVHRYWIVCEQPDRQSDRRIYAGFADQPVFSLDL